MNCQEVQTQLADYLDKALDTIRSKSIETHLLSCGHCRSEAESLADCIRQVRSLPMVEPPQGFAQRIMAHAHQIEPGAPFWRRLFFGGKFALPVPAAAMVLIAVFAVLLYQREPALQKGAPADRSAPPAALTGLTKEAATPLRAAAPESPATPASTAPAKLPSRVAAEPIRQFVGQAKNKPGPEALAFADKAPTETPAIDPAQSKKASGDAGEARRRAPIQAQEVATGRDSLRPSAEVFGAGRMASNLPQWLFQPSFSDQRALSPLSEPASDVEFVVRRRPAERREQKPGAAARERADADNTPAAQRSSASQTGALVEIRWFNVPAGRYEHFKKLLADEAVVETEKSTAGAEQEVVAKSAADLIIKVVILPPAER